MKRCFFSLKRCFLWVALSIMQVIGHNVLPEPVGPSAGRFFKELVMIGTTTSMDGEKGEVRPPLLAPSVFQLNLGNRL